MTALWYILTLIGGAGVGIVGWQLFVAGPEVRAADTAHAEIAAKLLNAQEQKREDDAEYNRLHDESIEIIGEWKAAHEAMNAALTEARMEADTWKTAYSEGLIGKQRALPAPVAAEAVMPPQDDTDEDERSFFDVLAAHVPVTPYDSGMTGEWHIPLDAVAEGEQRRAEALSAVTA